MVQISKVALAGATGNLGPAILAQLLQAGFEVTVLTRQGNQHKLPEAATVKEVDYDSLDSLSGALKGQHAVVSTLGSLALSVQLSLIKAAVDAGVQRFIPSEFGSNTVHPKTSQLPVFADKVAVRNALKKAASESGLTYTLVCNGPFLDWGLATGFLANPKERSINIYDGGNRATSATTLSTVGKAVAGVLKHLDDTKNRAVYIQDTAITGQQLRKLGEKATGTAWHTTELSISNLLQDAYAELGKDEPNPGVFVMNFLQTSIWGQGYGSPFEKTDNELLGLKKLDEDDIVALIKEHA